jgi:hypothetical protein
MPVAILHSEHPSNPFEVSSTDIQNNELKEAAGIPVVTKSAQRRTTGMKRRDAMVDMNTDTAPSTDDPIILHSLSRQKQYINHVNNVTPGLETQQRSKYGAKIDGVRYVCLDSDDGMGEDELRLRPSPQKSERDAMISEEGGSEETVGAGEMMVVDGEEVTFAAGGGEQAVDDGEDDVDDDMEGVDTDEGVGDEYDEDDDEQEGASSSAHDESIAEEDTLALKPPEEREEIEDEMEELMEAVPDLAENYRLIDRLGTGTFSSVYKAIDLYYHDKWDNRPWHGYHPTTSSAYYQSQHYDGRANALVAVKRIYVTSSPERIRNEIVILEDCRGCRHVSQLITAFRKDDQVVAIIPYQRNEDFRVCFIFFSSSYHTDEQYMTELLYRPADGWYKNIHALSHARSPRHPRPRNNTPGRQTCQLSLRSAHGQRNSL